MLFKSKMAAVTMATVSETTFFSRKIKSIMQTHHTKFGVYELCTLENHLDDFSITLNPSSACFHESYLTFHSNSFCIVLRHSVGCIDI